MAFVSKIKDPIANLAIEHHLFQTSTLNHLLFFYRNQDCVVLGRNQNPFRELLLDKLQVPLIRRHSGGGTVYHDMGNTNYCLMMPRNEFNRTIACELLVNGLHQLDIPAKMNERHDIVIDDKKVSGSAYKIANHRAYHHGTMLIDTDLELVQRTLEPSKRVLDGGGIHSVRSQVTNLRQYSFTVDHTSFVEEITHQFGKKYGHQPLVEIDDGILNEPKIKDIMETMQTREWLLGQTPPFKQQIQVQGHSIVLSVRKAIVVQIDAPTLPHTHKKSLEILLDVPYESIPKLLEQSNSDFLLEIKNKF